VQPLGNGPRLPRVYIPRHRLWEQLDRATEGALTLLVAPGGAGKTLGVGGWVTVTSIPHAEMQIRQNVVTVFDIASPPESRPLLDRSLKSKRSLAWLQRDAGVGPVGKTGRMDAIETRGRVRVEPATKRVRIMLGGVVVADTTAAVYVWENPSYPQYYFPLADVAPGALKETGTTSRSEFL